MKSKFNFVSGVMLLLTLTVANAQVVATNGEAIDGSPYLNDKYENGVIYYSNTSHTAPIRYNAFKDLIEYQQNGRAMVLDPSLTIEKVRIGTSTFVPQKYELNGQSKLGYFEILDSGNVMLFAKKKIIFSEAKKGGSLDGSDRPAQFRRATDEFYYKIGDGELYEVGSIKSMIKSFPAKQEELAQYAKKEKISPRKEKDIVQFVRYYNSL
jgi:hypothetical protein